MVLVNWVRLAEIKKPLIALTSLVFINYFKSHPIKHNKNSNVTKIKIVLKSVQPRQW